MKIFRSQLVEVAKDMHRLTLTIAHDMRDAPDDSEHDIKIIDAIIRLVMELPE